MVSRARGAIAAEERISSGAIVGNDCCATRGPQDSSEDDDAAWANSDEDELSADNEAAPDSPHRSHGIRRLLLRQVWQFRPRDPSRPLILDAR